MSDLVPRHREAERLPEITAVLIFLGVLLTIVTLVGHGIWVLVSRIFGGGRKSDAANVANVGALHVLRRQLGELAQRGAVDAETRSRLLAAIDDEERRLIAQQFVAPPVTPSLIAPAAPAASPSVAEPAAGQTPPGPANLAAAPAARHAPTPIEDRARQYAVSREAAAAEAQQEAEVAVADVEPRRPREALSRLFSAFMEEKNIRWGELVGGLLIVGCSIALVISFWSEIAARPLLKFLLFNGVTAALFLVGISTDRRWKIHTTSHGVLVIATLLVPLNFLAIAAFTQASPPIDLFSLAGEAVSLAVFALLVYQAGRILVTTGAAMLAVGVMVPCLMQLLIRRFAGPAATLAALYALSGVPVLSYLACTLQVVRKQRRANHDATNPAATLAEREGNRLLVFVGLVSAATLMPLTLLVYNVPPPRTTLHWLSPLAILCGLPTLIVGLLFRRRMTERRLSGLQTAGIGVGVLGAMIMVGAVALAWPDPATLFPTALATAAVMLVVAIGFAIPAAHVPAGVALAAAWLIAFYVLRGDVGWTVDSAVIKRSLLSTTSGHVLVPLAALFACLAWWLARVRSGAVGSAIADRGKVRGAAALMYALVAAATGAISLALVVWFGFARPGDPGNATWTLAIYALAAVAAAVLIDRTEAMFIGSALLLAALVQGVVYRYGAAWQLESPWVVALLGHASLTSVAAAAFDASRGWARRHARDALIWSAQATSFVAAAWLAATVEASPAGALGIHLAWLAFVWLLLSLLGDGPALFLASQIAFLLAIFCGVTAAVETRAWYGGSPRPWLDPWFLEAQAIALAGYCLIVAAFREAITQSVRRQSQYVIEPPTPAWRTATERLLNPRWPAIDQLAECAIVAILAVVVVYAAVPGAAQELAPTEGAGRVVPPIERFELAAIPHAHAASEGAWMLVVAVGLTLASRLRQGISNWRLVGLAVAVIAVCPLLAARWETQVAVASSLRWLSAGFFAILSIPIWWRRMELFQLREVRNLLVTFVVAIYVAMGAYVCQASLARANVAREIQGLLPWAWSWTLLAGVVAVLLPYAIERRPAAGQAPGPSNAWARRARDVLLLLAFAPLAVMLTFTVAKVLGARPIVGPEPGNWFREIGWNVSYGVPLVVVALAFIGHAIRDRSAPLAFAAGLLFNVVATIVVLLRLARIGALDEAAWITVTQANAIVAGVAALVWLAAVQGYVAFRRPQQIDVPDQVAASPPRQGSGWPPLLISQVTLAAALCGAFLFVPAVWLAGSPGMPAVWLNQAGHGFGWVALALTLAATIRVVWRRALPQWVGAYFTAALVAILALTSLGWDTGNWLGYHVLLTGCTAAAWLVPLLARTANRAFGDASHANDSILWSAISVRAFAVVAVLLAIVALDGDPAAPYWTIAALATISARNLWIAWREGGRGSVWIAAVLTNLAVSVWWLNEANRITSTRGPGQAPEFFWVNAIAAALVAILSVWIERTRAATSDGPPRGFALHRFAVWAIVAMLMIFTVGGLLDDLSANYFAASALLGWAAWLAGAAAAVATLWDPAIRWPVACLYLYGLVAVGMYLGDLDLGLAMFHWALANALAAYSLATSALWSGRDRLREIASRLGVPAASGKPQAAGELVWWKENSGHGWLVPANLLLGVFVLLLVGWVALTVDSFTQRMTAAYAVGAQALAIGLLARGAVRTPLQYLALVWGVFFAIAFGWAFLPTDFPAPWLHRLVVTVVALSATVVVYGFGFVKFLRRENEWTRAAARLVPGLAGFAAVLVLVVLGIEVADFAQDGDVPIAWPALVGVALALAGLTFAALAAALLPGRDPLGLSERGRTAYVYAAEALIALLFVHIRVTMPWLFHGWFQQFWPLVVMGIAFVGVGFGELFERRRQRVLSEPLQTSGALLPLLPAIGFWVLSSRVDYSLVLLSVGVLYAALSVLRNSLWYGVLAAVAANGSLWYLLSRRDGLSLTDHPQLWLIPPALCALAAGYINRRRLTDQQSAGLRYAAAIVIYCSSTADVFISGVADAPWLPAVLAGLSILGVLAGILVRVRAFLYLGTTFLVVALMTIIWHAAIHEQRTWILWLAGIVTGVLIIALFGLFEKRRDDVLRVVDELRHWQA